MVSSESASLFQASHPASTMAYCSLRTRGWRANWRASTATAVFSTGFSSGARDGSRMMVRFFGTLSLPVVMTIRPDPSAQPHGPIRATWRLISFEMHLHGLRVRPSRQHERRPLAVSRTDGAEQIGVAIALIGLAWAQCPFLPTTRRQAILLAKACFVLEPESPPALARRQVSYMHLERVGEEFF